MSDCNDGLFRSYSGILGRDLTWDRDDFHQAFPIDEDEVCTERGLHFASVVVCGVEPTVSSQETHHVFFSFNARVAVRGVLAISAAKNSCHSFLRVYVSM